MMQLTPKSYTIIVREGTKHMFKATYKSYDLAMERLSHLEFTYGDRYWIDFRSNYR